MKIVIETIPHEKHRYPTVGDWWRDPDGTLQIRVSEMPEWRYELLVAVHELLEQVLCKHHGSPEAEVTAFDMEHPELDDPGHSRDALTKAMKHFLRAHLYDKSSGGFLSRFDAGCAGHHAWPLVARARDNGFVTIEQVSSDDPLRLGQD